MPSRRSLIIQLSTTALVGALATGVPWAVAADKTVKIGINLPFTGADAHDAELIKDGALLAIDEANAQGGVDGYKLEVLLLDDGTATAGQYDPAQAATNARKMVADKGVVAALIIAAPRTLRRLRQLTGLALRGPLPAHEADLSRVDVPRLADDVVAGYVSNLRLVRLLAREYGFRPLFFWQPVITTKRSQTPDEQRCANDYTRDPAGRRNLYTAVVTARRCCRELVEAPDAIDLSALFDDWSGPVYIDLYHLSEAGNAAVAEAMLPAVAAAVSALGR